REQPRMARCNVPRYREARPRLARRLPGRRSAMLSGTRPTAAPHKLTADSRWLALQQGSAELGCGPDRESLAATARAPASRAPKRADPTVTAACSPGGRGAYTARETARSTVAPPDCHPGGAACSRAGGR